MLSSTLITLQEVAFDFERDLPWLKPKPRLQQAIVKTLAYFDVFNFPLTDWEIYKYLYAEELIDKKISYFQVRETLAHLPAVEFKDGFYFLAGQSELAVLRKSRQLIAREKYQRARRVAKLFSVLPFIKMVAVCNSLAYDNTRLESDIDFFIITRANKVWTTRFYSTLLLKIFHLRPKVTNKRDKVCVNFIIGENALNLQPLMIADDIYFKYWIKQLVPLYNQGGIFRKFVKINDYLSQSINSAAPPFFYNKRKINEGTMSKFVKFILEIINSGKWVENFCRRIQLKIMPLTLKTQAGKGTAVVINNSVLKFHEQDRRREYRDLWNNKIVKLLHC